MSFADFRVPTRPAAVTIVLLLGALIWMTACTERDTTTPTAPVFDDPAKVHTDTFTLVAYDLDSVHVAGSLNGWADQDPAWAMTLQPDGRTWRLITQVPDGLSSYKFVARKGAVTEWVTDPRAIAVAPDGYHSNPAYWNALRGYTFAKPAPLAEPIDRTRLVIYEVSLNDFSSAGTFVGATANLTSGADLVGLGVNAVELLPVTAPSYNGWGYDPVLQFTPNPSYGWPADLAGFINAAHGHGLAVILDAVLNHMSGSTPLRLLDTLSDTYHFTTTESNPWGLVELNWNDPALREHVLDSLCHWVDAYSVDGFRFDYIGGEPYSSWVWLKDELRARYPDLLLIAEDYTPPVYGNAVTNGYDAQWGGNHTDSWGGGGNNFNQVINTVLTQNGFAWRGETTPTVGAFGAVYNNMWAVANVVSANPQYADGVPGDGFSDIKYLESHDENRMVWMVDYIGSVGAQTVGGLHKAHMGAVLSLTSVGIPMLFNGQELGSGEYRPALPAIYKINWSGGDAGVRTTYSRLIDMRLNHVALRTEHTFFTWRPAGIDQTEFTLNYWRGSTADPASAEVVVACNFDHLEHTWDAAFPAAGNWVKFDLVAGTVETEFLGGTTRPTTLPGGTALLWFKEDGTTHVP